MNSLVVFIIGFVIFVFFLRWRISQSEKKMQNTPLPEQFDSSRLHPQGTLVFFHSHGCPPCRRMLPGIEQLAREHPGQVLSINLADEYETARAFHITGTPTTLWIENQTIAKAMLGQQSPERLEAFFTQTDA